MNTDINITWHGNSVTRIDRERLNKHRGCVLWFTGLSGCGKSSVANAVDKQLNTLGVHTYLLDGDNVRHGLNASPQILAARYDADFAQRFGLGFSAQDRAENIRRIGAVAQLFCDAGLITLSAFVSPYRSDRQHVREMLPRGEFFEIFVDAPLEVCEQRDPKGLYKKARAGELKGFTGIDAPYEAPENPELILDSAHNPVATLAEEVIAMLRETGMISV